MSEKIKKALSIAVNLGCGFEADAEDAAELLTLITGLESRIAELEEFKMIWEGCGFEVIIEPPVLNHPERKILKGHGTIYVPELPEPPEVQE